MFVILKWLRMMEFKTHASRALVIESAALVSHCILLTCLIEFENGKTFRYNRVTLIFLDKYYNGRPPQA